MTQCRWNLITHNNSKIHLESLWDWSRLLHVHLRTHKPTIWNMYNLSNHQIPNPKWFVPKMMLLWVWGADHTRQYRHHPSASLAGVVRKVVGHHLFLNIIPNTFTARTERKVWCDRGMRLTTSMIGLWHYWNHEFRVPDHTLTLSWMTQTASTLNPISIIIDIYCPF